MLPSILLDDEDPVVECPMNMTVDADPGQNFATVSWDTPNVMDNSGESLTATADRVSGSTFPFGVTTVNVNATDSSGNVGTCDFNITVQGGLRTAQSHVTSGKKMTANTEHCKSMKEDEYCW